MTVRVDDYYAREADRIARGPQLYGGNAAIVGLRCFKFYHPDQGSFLTAPDGMQRWMGPKASRIYAIAHRDAGKHTTMRAIAAEAMCCASTVSRALLRLQAFGFLAVDVKRGRNGGILVRLRRVGDALRHYANAAWRRIRSALNVASRLSKDVGELDKYLGVKDATFIQAWSDAEYRGRLLDETRDPATAAAFAGPPGPGSIADDRAQAFAREVIRERWRLAVEDPEGEADAIHPLALG